jgi:DNA topoisomerase-1
MDLIILESPNKRADVEKYARKCGLDVKVMATVGHLVDLPPMAEGAAVNLDSFTPEKLVARNPRAKETIAALKAAIVRAERVIVATDPDREGEAIAAQVWQWIPAGKAWRARFEEITAGGVAAGLSKMTKELDGHAVDASVARRLIDRLAGWHASNLVFEKLPQRRGVSAGRLQSAALLLVVERFRDNQSFKPIVTFGIRARLRGEGGGEFWARLTAQGKPSVFQTRAEAGAIKLPAQVVVSKLEVARKAEKPRPPFEATSWLQVAQKALGLSVKDATAATQALFETGSTTYPRTDSVRVSDDAIAWARAQILQRFGPQYVPGTPWIFKDSGASVQGAHEAIRPTLSTDAEALQQRKAGQWGSAYGLIEARFLASQAAAREVEQTVVLCSGGGIELLGEGQVELFGGWRDVLGTDLREEATNDRPGKSDEDADPDGALPRLQQGELLEVLESEVVTHTTKAKPLHTQASLIAELKRRGIGRPSTYHSVVPILLVRLWAEEKIWKGAEAAPAAPKQRRTKLPVLVPTELGVELADFLARAVPGLVNYGFTAALEAGLDEVERGERGRAELGKKWWEGFAAELRLAERLPAKTVERPVVGECPKCGREGRVGKLRLVKGVSRSSGEAYEFAACDLDTMGSKICGYTAPADGGKLALESPCPECNQPMRPVRRKDGGHSLVCEKDGWYLADRRWTIVKPPMCSRCAQPMIHRENSAVKGRFFWGCFNDKVFKDADQFGKVLGAPKATKAGKVAARR